jgi:antirestriction protein ArdC
MCRDIYQTITDQIVAELEKGTRPWLKPWNTDHLQGRVSLPLRHNGISYRGVNIVALWMTAVAKGYAAPFWMSFKQALDLGGCVRPQAPALPRTERGASRAHWRIIGRVPPTATARRPRASQ